MNALRSIALGAAIAVLAASPIFGADSAVSLSGRWRYALDRENVGMAEGWFARELTGTLTLPGSLASNGLGDPITTDTPWVGGIVDRSYFTAPEFAPYREPGNLKVPFWLQPETYYRGAVWYQRDIDIPETWAGSRVVLFLERAHWETRVWLDDRFLGSNDSLSTPHEYDLGTGLPVGGHRLTIRVDNDMVVNIGENSHSISDHTQGNWNGIVGRLELRATPPAWIQDLVVYPNAATRAARIVVQATNSTQRSFVGQVTLRFPRGRQTDRPEITREVQASGGDLSIAEEVEFGAEAPLWDEFQPELHTVQARLTGKLGGQPIESEATVRFGLRDFATDGTQFTINGRKTFLRGTLECAIFPRTGHTPTDLASWTKVMRAAKSHGLNNLRFHSHCPPEAAFQAADEAGMYLHVECGSWANQSTTLGDGKPVDAWVYREADRILKAYGNHPSFVMLLYGNEPGGRGQVAYLKEWVKHYQTLDPRRLYSSGAGWPKIPENQFHVVPEPRIHAWGAGLRSRINARPPETVTDYREAITAEPVPIVSHEIGQWCVYPNFDEIRKYTGYLKPRNFEIFQDSLRSKGMLDQARDFLHASGRLQTLCYKEEIESALRTLGMGGFQLLDLHDFPGQGTALVGVLDPFWESKGYVYPAEFRRFCNPTVPLARLAKRVFTTDETLVAQLEVAHFGEAPFPRAVVTYKLIDDRRKAHRQGQLELGDLPVGNGTRLGDVRLDLSDLPAPARYRLVVSLDSAAPPPPPPPADAASTDDAPVPALATAPTPPSRSPARSDVENDWDLWVYPAQVTAVAPPGITVVHDLDEAAASALEAGGTVLWLVAPDRVKPDPKLGKVALGFSSIFWNTAWTGRQPPHTLGILCDPRHPLFRQFPTEFHSNWQWWYLVTQAGAMILDELPRDLRPTVQVVDDWFTNRKLALVFEARVGQGRLAVCSVDLEDIPDSDPVRRQFRRTLLDYLAGRDFRPRNALTLAQVRSVARPESTP